MIPYHPNLERITENLASNAELLAALPDHYLEHRAIRHLISYNDLSLEFSKLISPRNDKT